MKQLKKLQTNIKIGQNIYDRRKELQMSAESLGKLVNLTKKQIRRYELGEIRFRTDILEDFANALNLPVHALFKEMENVIDEERELLTINKYKKIKNKALINSMVDFIYDSEGHIETPKKVIDFNKYKEEMSSEFIQESPISYKKKIRLTIHGEVSAGSGAYIPEYDQYEIDYYDTIPNHDLALKIKGDSMEPLFRDGEIIFVREQPSIDNGQIGIVVVENEGFVKKIYTEEKGLRLVSLNTKYEDIVVSGENVRTVGKVIL